MKSLSRIALWCGIAIIAAGMTVWAEPGDVFFVDASRGVDSLNCGAIDTPCRSIQAAVDRIPMVFTRDVTVSIAPGTYDGGIMIVGRISPGMARLTLLGEPGGVTITGPEGVMTGVAIIHSFNVALENLRIEAFAGAGVKVTEAYDSQLRSVVLAGNTDGIFLGQSEATIVGTIIENNLRHGVNCEGGWLTLGGDHVDPTILNGNAVSGVRADLCHAIVRGPVAASGNGIGLFAMNAGQIDLGTRDDVRIQAAAGESALTADHHGMITGTYACVGSCECTATRYGLCEAGLAVGGRNRRTVYDQQD